MKHFAMLSIVLFVVAFAVAQPARAQQYTFTFNPPDGTQVLQTNALTETQQSGPKDKTTHSASQQIRILFKKTDTGFTMTQTPLLEDGKPSKAKPQTLELDAKGNCVALQNMDELRKQMVAKITAKMREQGIDEKYVDKWLSAKVAEAKDQCQEYYGLYAGKTVKIGDVWKDTLTMDIDQGITAPVYRTITFAGTVQKDGKTCLRIKYSATADEKALQSAVNKLMAARDKQAKAQGQDPKKLPRIIGMSKTRVSERIVDPATMLDYGETTTIVITQRITMPGQGTITVTTTQKQVSTVKFEK